MSRSPLAHLRRIMIPILPVILIFVLIEVVCVVTKRS